MPAFCFSEAWHPQKGKPEVDHAIETPLGNTDDSASRPAIPQSSLSFSFNILVVSPTFCRIVHIHQGPSLINAWGEKAYRHPAKCMSSWNVHIWSPWERVLPLPILGANLCMSSVLPCNNTYLTWAASGYPTSVLKPHPSSPQKQRSSFLWSSVHLAHI